MSDAPMLSEVMEVWIKDKSREAWREKTAKEHRVWVTQFITAMGDKPIDGYTKSDARGYKEIISRLPPSWSLRSELKGLSIDKASLKAEALGLEPMSVNNLNKILRFTGSLWNWMQRNYDEVEVNPFSGLRVSNKSSPRKARDGFTVDELNTIFSTPIYTGCLSERKWSQSGNYTMQHTAKFWVPLISLYTGMRLDEILQLRYCDVCSKEDVYFFDVNEDGEGKNLKNASSTRLIPLHNNLVSMGFLEFIDGRKPKSKTERIFRDVKKGNDGTYSYTFSKHFSRFLKEAGVKTNKNSFHSFRHTFEDGCRNSGVPKEVMDAVQGHSSQDMSGRYGSGYSLEFLNKWIQKVDYGGLRLP